ncbi:hypothetical protein AAU61_19855 [Desulfocarbo indianensis]|nr:hypothetical protein AAU61_19855 [Desulfocarbo indianensis]
MPVWHQDCVSLTVILASAYGVKAMKKLLRDSGYEEAAKTSSPELLLEALHGACHQDDQLARNIAKELDKKYRHSLVKVAALPPEGLEQGLSQWSWRLPPLWSCYRQPEPRFSAQGRRLAHLMVWEGMRALRQKPVQEKQAEQLKKLAQKNKALVREAQELRQALALAKSRQTTERIHALPSPTVAGEQTKEAGFKKDLKELRRRLAEANQENQTLRDDLSVWRALALSQENNPPQAQMPRPMPCEEIETEVFGRPPCPNKAGQACGLPDCDHCPLKGRTVAVIGGIERMETNYKEAVQRLGGECLCHTGKVRGGCRRLRQVVSKSDLVVFITQINSHAAMASVKDECKKCGKPFRVLARTGASSLEKLLQEVAA